MPETPRYREGVTRYVRGFTLDTKSSCEETRYFQVREAYKIKIFTIKRPSHPTQIQRIHTKYFDIIVKKIQDSASISQYILLMTNTSKFYYEAQLSEDAYSYLPSTHLSIARLLQNKAYFQKFANQTLLKKKILILHDDFYQTFNRQFRHQGILRERLVELQYRTFKIIVEQTKRLKKLKISHCKFELKDIFNLTATME